MADKAIKPMTEEEASVPLTDEQKKDVEEMAKLLSNDHGETGGSVTGEGRKSPFTEDKDTHGFVATHAKQQKGGEEEEGKNKGGGFLEFFGLAGGRRRRRRKSRKSKRKSRKSKKKSKSRRSRRRRGGVLCDVRYDDSTGKWEQEEVAGIYNDATGKYECPKIEEEENKGNRYAKTIKGGKRRRRKSRKSKRKSRRKSKKRRSRRRSRRRIR